MDKKKRMSKEKRREHIVSAALKSFSGSSYRATTTASIAKAAGVSEVTLFRHFSSKEELFKAVTEPILEESLEDIEIHLQEKDLNPTERLKVIIKNRIEFISRNHKLISLILRERKINPEIIPFDYVERTHVLLEKAVEEAGIKSEDRELTLRLLIGSILSFLYFPENSKINIEKYVDQLIAMIKSNSR
ncbi:MAG: TetR/AcrR family transcriptional regulator [Tetragenococcus koreensis]|nr:TetR/AcrR family transcriptional regulator [Tetragenococcus koreensis]